MLSLIAFEPPSIVLLGSIGGSAKLLFLGRARKDVEDLFKRSLTG